MATVWHVDWNTVGEYAIRMIMIQNQMLIDNLEYFILCIIQQLSLSMERDLDGTFMIYL